MKPPRFEYFDPATVGEVVSLLEKYGGEAKILAGGQSLVPLLNMRMARPEVLVDIGKLTELDYIRESDGALAVGAGTTKRTVEDSELVKTRQPLLYAATLLVGHPPIRNRGTVGGSLAQADPAAEYPAVAVALDAELKAVGPGGERSIRAADFYVTYLTTALEPSEVLTEVRFPAVADRTGCSCQEVTRRHGDFAITGAATTVTLDGAGKCTQAKIVLFGVGPTPVRAREAEKVMVGQAPVGEIFEQAAWKASEEIDEPLSDVHGSAEYRRHLAGVLTRRGLAEAAGRAAGTR